MLLFLPVLSVSTFCLVVQLLVSWTSWHGAFVFASYFTVEYAHLYIYINKDKSNIVFPVQRGAVVSPAALCSRHLCPHRALEANAWCPQETVNGNVSFPNISFLLKGISLVCNKAWVAEISTAHHGRREWSKNSDGRVVRGSRSFFSFWVSFSHFIFSLLLGK